MYGLVRQIVHKRKPTLSLAWETTWAARLKILEYITRQSWKGAWVGELSKHPLSKEACSWKITNCKWETWLQPPNSSIVFFIGDFLSTQTSKVAGIDWPVLRKPGHAKDVSTGLEQVRKCWHGSLEENGVIQVCKDVTCRDQWPFCQLVNQFWQNEGHEVRNQS